MVLRVPDNYPSLINQYVPAMAYASDVNHQGTTMFSLGTPAVADSDGILDGVSATNSATSYTSADFVTAFDGTLDATYGRNLTAVGSAGSDHVCTVTGRDYLGQVMTETLTLSGTTSIVGEKAFKFITGVAIATGAASDTADFGWGSKLGLPYKAGHIEYGVEDGVITTNGLQLVYETVADVTVSSTNAATFTTQITGYVLGFEFYITTSVTSTIVVMDCIIGGTGVAGLDLNVPIATAGFSGRRLVSMGLANTGIIPGETVTLTSDGASAAGAVEFTMISAPPYFTYDAPDITDPATAATRDTRGTYTPFATMDGSIELFAVVRADPAVNSSGNGGLYGIKQV